MGATYETTTKTNSQKRSPRSHRQPRGLAPRLITRRALVILSSVALYRFAPTSLIVALAGGDARTTADHLFHLYHRGILNRFQMTRNGEFVYYVDSTDALKLLLSSGYEVSDQIFEWVRNNRERDYAGAVRRQDPGQLLFLAHELMVSRFHAAIELACRTSDAVELVSFRQGAVLHNQVRVPKVLRNGQMELPAQQSTEVLPHRPDAAFTLRFRKTGALSTFLYEADRKTSSTIRFRQKLRAHFHFIVRQRLHEKLYGVSRIRAVLTETVDASWAEALRESAGHPSVSGATPSSLFWFAPSAVFSKPLQLDVSGRQRQMPLFLLRPEIMFEAIWATPVNDNFHSLLDS